jgi:hypothetical protein
MRMRRKLTAGVLATGLAAGLVVKDSSPHVPPPNEFETPSEPSRPFVVSSTLTVTYFQLYRQPSTWPRK